MNDRWQLFIVTLLLLALEQTASAQQTKLLCGFEGQQPPRIWEYNTGEPQLVKEGVTQGKTALQLTFAAGSGNWGAYLVTFRLPRDWSGYDALVLDVWNPNDKPIPAYLLIGDRAWQESGGSYWNRHNSSRSFPPGQTAWQIPLDGLYRGEAGSRNNDIDRNIDSDSIVRLDLGFGTKGTGGRVVIDNLRLVKTAAPENVWAFDLGPVSQSLMLGWTPVSPETTYSPEKGYGWGPRGGAPWPSSARDTTFGTALLQDFCEAGGYNFHVAVPRGEYHVTMFYENSGYWGGEQAQHRQRRILANGREVWSERRSDGPAHSLYRFENLEPIDVDVWETYMLSELARPVTFDVDCANEGLTLRFEADRTWGSKVAAIAIAKAEDQQALNWIEQQLALVAEEFRGKAVCLDPPPKPFALPAAWSALGLAAWPVRIEDEMTPNTTPDSLDQTPTTLALKRMAVQGEAEPFCLAVRPTRDLETCQLELEPFHGPGTLEAKVQVVWYNTSRGFGRIDYHVRPHTVREAKSVVLPKNVTREVLVTAQTRENTPPGTYHARLLLKDRGGRLILALPLALDVRPVRLVRETDYQMGFFGLMPPSAIPSERRSAILEETLQLLRDHGMNAISGGPSWSLKGWRDGQPIIDFEEMDRFFALVKRSGFTGPINGYGGLRFQGLHDRYVAGQTARRVAQQSGLEFEVALMRAWRAVDRHARQAGWPTIYYAMCDETRVRQQAEKELDFMYMMQPISEAFPDTIRTSGSYSVHFRTRPDNPDDMLYWHQRFFAALDINSLNNHDASVMAEAKKLGKAIHIYNQGRTRYSFGLYQWSEYSKGVRARWQWHLNVLHGYQFFDLDGREPDTSAICYGRERIYPTISFERCREGAEDFYLYNTLAKRVDAAAHEGLAYERARRLLESLTERVQLNQRDPPDDFDADELKAEVVAVLEQL